MRRLHALSLTTVAGLSLMALPSTALAQSGGWSYGVGASSDNRSKQVSKSETDPFAWALAEWTSDSGMIYGGPSVETIDAEGSNLEATLGFGMRPQLAGFDLDLNLSHKWRIDANPGTDDDAWELTADVRRAIGPAEATLRLQYSPDGMGDTGRWTWVEARASWALTLDTRLSGGVGRREQELSPDYTGWDVGVTWQLTRSIDLDLRYHDTDADPRVHGQRYGSALVAGVGFYF